MPIIKKLRQIFDVKADTVYSNGIKLQVVENDEIKMFKLNDVTHSIINKKSIYTKSYLDYFIPLAYFYKNPRVLMLGLGLGTNAYQLRNLFGKKVSIDIIEKNPDVVKLARKHVDSLKKEKIIVVDAANFVSKTKKKYDLIILDVYEKGASIPKQFMDEKFVSNTGKVLSKNGILAINYAMHPAGVLQYGEYKKLLEKFFKVYVFNTDSVGSMRMIVCYKTFDRGKVEQQLVSFRYSLQKTDK